MRKTTTVDFHYSLAALLLVLSTLFWPPLCSYMRLFENLIILALALLQLVQGFRVLQSGDTQSNDSYPGPYQAGFVGVYGDPTNLQRERINEGNFESPEQELLYEGVSPRQACPNMVGPFSDGNYYCTAREFGYCDRRSGTCFCNIGYKGIDCTECQDTHYQINSVCFPRKLCPNDCSGSGSCDYGTGTCNCLPHRKGTDCSILLCSRFSTLCTSCSTETCLNCASGYYLNGDPDVVCASCFDFDPRCAGCTLDQGCTTCADSLLSSVHRSGYRTSDPALPVEEETRELGITLPFGTKSPEAFADAENFEVVTTPEDPLNSHTQTCSQGPHNASWECSNATASHIVCGHFGVFTFKYPNYAVPETEGAIRMSVLRSGGGYGSVQITYSIKHFTTNDSDVVATAPYTTVQRLDFTPGVVERSFLITIADDNLVEEDEVFQVVLEQPEGGGAVGTQFRANVTILDDDRHKLSPKLSKCLQNTTTVSPAEQFDVYVQAVDASGEPMTMGGERFYAIIGNNPEQWQNIKNPLNSTSTLRQPTNVTDLGNGLYRITSVEGIKVTGVFNLTVYHAFPNSIRGDYFKNSWFTNLAVWRLDQKVDFDWGTGRLIPSGTDFISVRWTGAIRPDAAGNYTFAVEANDYARLYVNNHLLINNWYGQVNTTHRNRSDPLFLVGHVLHEVVLEYLEIEGAASCRLLWAQDATSPLTVIPQANLYSLFEVDRSPIQVTVVGGPSSSDSTTAVGGGLTLGTAALESGFSVCPRDAYGNLIDDGNLFYDSTQLFTAKMTLVDDMGYGGQGPEVVTPDIAYNFTTNCYDFSYTPKMAGNYSLQVWFEPDRNGTLVELSGSPTYVFVEPAPTFAPNTQVRGLPSPLYMEAGKCFNFTIVARDGNMNLRKQGGDDFSVYMYRVNQYNEQPGEPIPLPHSTQPTSQPTGSPTSSPTNIYTSFTFSTSPLSDAPNQVDVVRYGRVHDFNNGNYSAEICPVVSGVYEIHVLLGGDGVSNQPFQIIDRWHSLTLKNMALGTGRGQYVDQSPYTLVVKHTNASIVTTTAAGPGLEGSVVGVPINFLVTVRDPYDNVLRTTYPPATITVSLDMSPTANVSIWNFKNGSFNVQYISRVPGENLISVRLNGYHIRASPYRVPFLDGATSPRYSFATGPGLFVGSTGEPSYFEVYAYDLDNNRKTTSDDLYYFMVSGANTLGPVYMQPCPSPPIQDHPICNSYDTQLGHYFGVFVPTIAGTDYVSVFLDSTASSSGGRRLASSSSSGELFISNFSSLVVPSAPKAELTDVSGTLYDNVAGVTTHVYLHLRDYYNNLLIQGGNSIEVALLAVGTVWGTEEPFTPLEGLQDQFYYRGFYGGLRDVYGNMTDLQDGRYTLTYNAPVAGEYVLRLALAETGLNATYFNTTNFGQLYDDNHNDPTFAARQLGRPVNLGSTVSWTGDIGGVPGARGDMGQGSYYNRFLSRTEATVDFDLTHTSVEEYMGNANDTRYRFRNHFWSARWTGLIIPAFAEVYKFSAVMDSDSALRVFIGGRGSEFNQSEPGVLVIDGAHGQVPPGTFDFTDTRYREIVVEYSHTRGDPFLSLFWESPSTPREVLPASALFHWRNISHTNLTIHPAPLCPHCSTAYGAALTSAQVAVKKSFVVYARDSFGNLLQRGGDQPTMVAIGRDGVAFRGQVTDYLNSTYLVEYYPTQSGTFRMYVTMGCCVLPADYGYPAQVQQFDHLLVAGAPFVLTVDPAPVDQSRTVVAGQGLLGGTADEVVALIVSFRDVHNNPTAVDTIAQSQLNVTFVDALTGDLVVPALLRVNYSLTNVTVAYQLIQAGKFSLSLSLSVDGGATAAPIIGSPYSVFVSPVKPVAANAVCRGLGMKQAATNRTAQFEVQLFDRFRNNLIVGGDKLYVRLLGDARFHHSSLPVVPLCADTQNGRYVCRYTPVENGTHQLVVRLLNNSLLHPGGFGLTGQYFESADGATALSPPTVTRVDPVLTFDFASGLLVPAYDELTASAGPALPLGRTAGQSVRWTGYLVAPRTDRFSLVLRSTGLNVSLYLDSSLVFDSVAGIAEPVQLTANAAYAVRVLAVSGPSVVRLPASIDLRWSTPTVPEYSIPAFFLYDSAQDVALSPFPVLVAH